MSGVREELEVLLPAWLSTIRSRSQHTARAYEAAVGRFVEQLDDGPVMDEAVARYLDCLLESGLAPASRAQHVSACRTFCRFAQARGVLEKSVVDMLVRPHVSIASFGRYLDTQELRRLVAAARGLSPRHLAAVLLLAGTGLRVNEAVKAEWRDLYRDPASRLGLRVRFGKGSKERVVKVRADVFVALAALHGSEELDAQDRSPLLPRTDGEAYSSRGLFELIDRSVKAAGLDKPATPHWLRHSHATLAAYGGSSAFEIQSALGHARLETSQRYISWARGLERTTVDSLPALT